MRSLRQVAEGLQYAQQSFSDALLRLPRAEDYEPLVAPLREFARISPALVEALRAVVELGGGSRPLAVQSQGVSATTSAVPTRVEEALRCVEAAHEAVRSALAALPGESDYRPVASQLRELATVSPSLMEWLREVPRLAAPLRGSVQALRRAADDLRSASDLLRDVAGEPT